jgi:hypothetical protein
MPSNRKFGIFFTVIFLACFIYFYYIDHPSHLVFLILSATLGITAWLKPNFLNHLNKAWHLLGLGLGKIVNPIILGIMFFLMITPIAIGMKLFKRDVLFLKKRKTKSYWIDRNPQGPDSESFKNQF